LSLEPTWIVVLALSVLNDIDLMFACLAKAGVVASAAAIRATVAAVLRKTCLAEDIFSLPEMFLQGVCRRLPR
jgi:hypothetical protein